MTSDATTRLLSVMKGEVLDSHSEGGWPEFAIEVRFFVETDDVEAVKAMQTKVMDMLADCALEVAPDA